MNLENMTPQQLRKMADELEAQIAQKPVAKQPSEIDVNKFIKFAEGVREAAFKGPYDEDSGHWAFELVMEEVFGKDFFKWFNKTQEKY